MIDTRDIKPGDMLSLLDYVEWNMPHLLESAIWHDVFIDYHEPFVERVWCQMGSLRVFVHRVRPSTPKKALRHRHGWPSAMKILRERYTMDVGSCVDDTFLPAAARVVLNRGDTYEMTSPNGYHAVIPDHLPSVSLMVTAVPWAVEGPKATKPLGRLDPALREELLGIAREDYPRIHVHQERARERMLREDATRVLYLHALGESVPAEDLAFAMNEGRLRQDVILKEEAEDATPEVACREPEPAPHLAEGREMVAQYDSICARTGQQIAKGETIRYIRGVGIIKI